MKEYNAKLNSEGKKFAVISARFNELISEKLVEGAKDCLLRHGCKTDDIDLIRVPGAFEIPLAVKAAVKNGKYNAVICLGAIIRGATTHHEYVASEAAKGIAQVSLNEDIPVSFGILTTETLEQAIERAGTKAGNKGWDAALSAVEMANLMEMLTE